MTTGQRRWVTADELGAEEALELLEREELSSGVSRGLPGGLSRSDSRTRHWPSVVFSARRVPRWMRFRTAVGVRLRRWAASPMVSLSTARPIPPSYPVSRVRVCRRVGL
jgi:hypothetical protein